MRYELPLRSQIYSSTRWIAYCTRRIWRVSVVVLATRGVLWYAWLCVGIEFVLNMFALVAEWWNTDCSVHKIGHSLTVALPFYWLATCKLTASVFFSFLLIAFIPLFCCHMILGQLPVCVYLISSWVIFARRAFGSLEPSWDLESSQNKTGGWRLVIATCSII